MTLAIGCPPTTRSCACGRRPWRCPLRGATALPRRSRVRAKIMPRRGAKARDLLRAPHRQNRPRPSPARAGAGPEAPPRAAGPSRRRPPLPAPGRARRRRRRPLALVRLLVLLVLLVGAARFRVVDARAHARALPRARRVPRERPRGDARAARVRLRPHDPIDLTALSAESPRLGARPSTWTARRPSSSPREGATQPSSRC